MLDSCWDGPLRGCFQVGDKVVQSVYHLLQLESFVRLYDVNRAVFSLFLYVIKCIAFNFSFLVFELSFYVM